MQLLLAILLYLQLIVSPGTYNQSYINQLEAENHARIEAVKASESEMEVVERDYIPQTEGIVIIDEQTEN